MDDTNIVANEYNTTSESSESDSILNCVKKLCGIYKDDTSFDTDIIVNINSALLFLTMMGIGPKLGFQIEDDKATFSNFLGENNPIQGSVSQYLYIKTKLGFDPPSNGTVIEQLNEKARQIEFYLNASQDEPYSSEFKSSE